MYKKTPWGFWLKFISSPWFWMKFIHVDKGHQNSLHVHHKRNEFVLRIPFHFFFIKKEKPHRLATGNYIELAYGRPSEDDILRLEDDYARV